MSADALLGEIIVPMTAVNDDLVAWIAARKSCGTGRV
jgi:hypothetical protein